MSKILGGAAIGFLVCSLLAFFVVAAVFSSSDNADTRSLGLLAAMMYSPLAGFMGAVIGAIVGAVMEQRSGSHCSKK